MINNIYTVVARRGWIKFCAHPQDSVIPVAKVFYSNMLQQDQHNSFVWQVQVPLNSRVINVFYDLPPVIDCEYTKFAENMTVNKWGEVFKTFIVQGSKWINEEGIVVNRIDLKHIAKVWVKFLKSRLTPITHTTTVSQDRLILLYVRVMGLAIYVGRIIEKEIREGTISKNLLPCCFLNLS